MLSGIDREEEGSTPPFITDITDKNELEETRRIANKLGKDTAKSHPPDQRHLSA
jgi:hypothetical protein